MGRCGLYYSGEVWGRYFAEAKHLERLDLMRNIEVHEDLTSVFDPENADLEIDIHERDELAFAFLASESKIHKVKD